MEVRLDLIGVIQRLTFCREEGEVLAVLRDWAKEIVGADGITVVLRDGDCCHYVEEDAIGPLWKGKRFKMRECISGWCMLHREQVAIVDIYEDVRIPKDAYAPTFVRSLAMVPIRSEHPIGAIGAYWATNHEATDDELDVMQALADSASMAFSNVQHIGELKEASRRKDEFLAMLAHELRNPLEPISNAADLLGVQGDDPRSVQWAQEVIHRQLGHMSRIVDDLLDMSRMVRGHVVLRREKMDLTRLVKQAVDDRQPVFEASQLALDVDLPEGPICVDGDGVRLAQVLGNVLKNALKFTPAGGRVTVRLWLDEGRNEAVLCVRDTGEGIPAELLPHVFEVFSQADESLHRQGSGLGLGLPVAATLMRLHGGGITVTSEGKGKGCEFVMRLPVAVENPAIRNGDERGGANGHRCFHVLVVEDNHDSAEGLRKVLTACGHEVHVAETGPDGVDEARRWHPEVVICDIGLPGMDGYEVAATLRGDPETASARLIALTGYGQDADKIRTLNAGFNAHLVKPVEVGSLLREFGA